MGGIKSLSRRRNTIAKSEKFWFRVQLPPIEYMGHIILKKTLINTIFFWLKILGRDEYKKKYLWQDGPHYHTATLAQTCLKNNVKRSPILNYCDYL